MGKKQRTLKSSPPVFEKLPPVGQFVEGGDAYFECRVQGEPTPNVVWTRKGMVIKNGNRHHVTYDPESGYSTLSIKKLTVDDDGDYICTAVNSAGEACLTVSITRQQPPLSNQSQISLNQALPVQKNSSFAMPQHHVTTSISSNNFEQLKKLSEYADTVDGGPIYYSGNDENFRVDTFEYRLLREIEFRENLTQRCFQQLEITKIEHIEITNVPSSAPQIHQKLRNRKVREGTEVTFQSKVTGNPTPDLFWFKDGRPLKPLPRVQMSYKDNIATLKILKTKPEDAGYYTLLAQNKYGRMAYSAHLVIEAVTDSLEPHMLSEEAIKTQTAPYLAKHYTNGAVEPSSKGLKPHFIRIPNDKEVAEGKLLKFDCRVGGRPMPEVSWYHNGKKISDDGTHKILINEGGDHSFMITLTTRNDAGLYTCVATNKYGEAQFDVNLTIIEKELVVAPKFVERFQSVHINEGDPLTLHCRAVGTPVPNLTWQKDGNQIYSIPPNLIIETGEGASSLYLTEASVKDAGWYQCTASNEAGSTATRGRVYVNPAPVSYHEAWNGLNLPKPQKVIEPEKSPPRETIYLRHIERPPPALIRDEDEPRYISQRPAFTTHIRDLQLVEGDRALFDARLVPIGDPNLQIEWYFNGRLIEPSSRIMTTFRFGYVALNLLHVNLEDAGVYSCRAFNDAGEATTTATLKVAERVLVDLQPQYPDSLDAIRHLEDQNRYKKEEFYDDDYPNEPPVFIKPLSSLDNMPENGRAHFEGQITPVNDPTMRVEWYLNGKLLNSGSRIGTVFNFGYVALNIDGLRHEDSGVYMCKAINAKGEAMSTATLKVTSSAGVVYDSGIDEQKDFIRKTQELEDYYHRQYHPEVIEESPSSSPRFVKQLTDQIDLVEGKTAHFEAALEPEGDSTMKVEWFKNGQPLEASSRITTFYNFGYVSLTIKGIDERDNGVYTCVATNCKGQDQTSANLRCVGKKSIIMEAQYDGDWEKVRHVEDTSRYKRHEAEDIEINQKPTFIPPLTGPDKLIEGQSAHFETRLEPMFDPNMKVEWYHNGKPLIAGHRFKTYFDFGYVALDVLYIFPEDSGTFTVVATNKLGEDSLSKEIVVQPKSSIDTSTLYENGMEQIRHLERDHKEPEYIIDEYSRIKPYFVQPLSDPKRVLNEGETVHLEARIEPVNDPSMTVEWFFNGKPLKTGHRFKTKFDFGFISLDILDLFTTDTGEYTVRVSNQLGSAHSSACVKVAGKGGVITETQFPEGMEKIRHLEDSSHYKKEELIEQTINQAPTFTKPLHNVETVEGTNVHLECRLLPIGDPNMTVEWFKNGTPLPAGHRFRPRYDFDYVSLDTLGVGVEDSGIYTCKAKNALGEAVTSCSVKVHCREPNVVSDPQHPEAYQQIRNLEMSPQYRGAAIESTEVNIKPTFLTRPKDIIVPEGKAGHFECRIEPISDPNLKVEWFHNGNLMMAGNRYQPFHDFGYIALNILQCVEEDSGTYICRVTNKLGSAETSANLKCISRASVDLQSQNPEGLKKIRQLEDYSRYAKEDMEVDQVRAAPLFKTAPKNVEIGEGKRAHFECQLTPINDPNLKVEWYKDGVPVMQGSRFVEAFDFGYVALDIMAAYPEDAGTYTCKAVNDFGEATTSATLKCYPDKSLITESQFPDSLEAIQKLESYKFQKVEQEEERTTQPPVFTQPMNNLELNENQTAHFECRLIPVGDPTLKVEWFHNGLPLLQGSRVQTLHDFGYVALDLFQTLPQDSGIFTCKATNDLGEAVCSATLKVTGSSSVVMDTQFPEGLEKIAALESQQKFVKEQISDRITNSAPIFVTPLQGQTRINEGQSCHLECRVEPFPDPTMKIEWFHNGQPLPLGHRFRTLFDFVYASLDLLSATPEDSGEYTIKASNHLGSATSSINIEVFEKGAVIRDPQQPESLEKIRALENQDRYKKQAFQEVQILEKPMFVRPLYNLDNLKEGQGAHLEATLTPVNDPSMKLEWFVNGRPIESGSRYSPRHDFGYVALDIAAVRPEDSGTYMCRATNKNGEAISTCSVKVEGSSSIETGTLHEKSMQRIEQLEAPYIKPAEAPPAPKQKPVFTSVPKSLDNVKEGSSAHLECRLKPINDPNLRVEWYHNGNPLLAGHRFRTTHDFGYVALDILYAYPEDTGTYMCRAVNEVGEAVCTVNINVNAKKSIYQETYHPEGLEKIQILESYKRPSKAEIEEKPITKPLFLSELQGATEYREGQRAHFEAKVDPAHDPNLKIDFYHNGQLLEAGSRFHITCDFGYIALDILQLVPEDAGTYMVIASNELGQAQSSLTISVEPLSSIQADSLHSSALSKIYELEHPYVAEKIQEVPTFQKPVFTHPLENLDDLVEGGNAHMECRLIPVGDPNLKVEWLFNNQPLTTGSRFKTLHDFGYNALDITHLMPEDEGVYMCRATNLLGEAVTSCSAKVKSKKSILLESQHPKGFQKIQELERSKIKIEAQIADKEYEKPVFTTPIIGPQELNEGQAAHFECRVVPVDDPNLKIQWYLNGIELQAGSRFHVFNDFGYVRLDIKSVGAEDSGIYMCRAINKAGEAITSTPLKVLSKSSILSESINPNAYKKTQQFELDSRKIPEQIDTKVHKPPVFTEQLSNFEMLVEDQNVHITGGIEPIDDETLRIEWYKNGKSLVLGSRIISRLDFGRVSLDILGLRPDDSGMYTCRAVNKAGEAVSTSCIRVADRESLIFTTNHPESLKRIQELESYQQVRPDIAEPEFSAPIFVTHLNNVELKEGETAHFECRVEPSTDCSLEIEFLHNNKPLIAGSRYAVRNDFGYITLDINRCQAEDAGIYSMVAKNKKGKVVSTGSLKVHSKGSIISKTQLPKGDEALRKIQKLEAGPTYLPPVEGDISYPPPTFVVPLEPNFTVAENRSVHMECRVEPLGDPNLTIEWYWNGNPMEMSNRFNILNDFGFVLLEIKDAWPRDSGIITCKAKNKQGEAFTSTTLLVVSAEGNISEEILHPEGARGLEQIQRMEESRKRTETVVAPQEGHAPKFTSQFKPLTNTKKGGSAHFEATLEPVGDETMKIEWFRNNKPIQASHRIKTFYSFGLVLIEVVDLRPEDAGVYTCRASNKWGKAEISVKLEILSSEKGEKPKFTSHLNSLSGLKEGDSAHFECTLTPVNDPELFVKWYKNKVELRESSRIKTVSNFGFVVMDISDIQEEDSGEYVCVATNKYGSDVSRCTIECKGNGRIFRESLQPSSLQKIAQLEGYSKVKQHVTVESAINQKPQFISQIQRVADIVEGQSAHFEAQLVPINDPNLKIEWFVNGRPLTYGHRFRSFHDFGIVILDILDCYAEDSGEYTCRATNKLGSDVTTATLACKAKSSVILDPQIPSDMASNERIMEIEEMRSRKRKEVIEELRKEVPVFIKPLENLPPLKEGENAHFEAKLIPTDDSKLTVEWYKDGKLLRAGTRIKTIHDFGFVVLEISPVYAEDSGVYTCRAFNEYGEAVSTGKLHCEGKRNVILETQLPVGMEGGIEKIAQLEELSALRAPEKWTDTEIAQAPQFITQPKDLELKENALAHFECHLTPTSDPTMRVDWYHNGRPLVTGSRVKTISDFGYVILEVAGVYLRDSGIYTCEAVNKYGKASVSCKLTVKGKQSLILEPQLPQDFIKGTESIQRLEESKWKTQEQIYDQEKRQPPKFVTTLQDLPERCEGDSAHFECRLEPVGDPSLRVEWFHNGKPLTTGSRVHTVNDFGFVVLEIDWLFPRDSGEYLCKATNKYGTDITKATLKIKSKRSVIMETQLPPEFSVDKLRQLDTRQVIEIQEEETMIQAPKFVNQIQPLEGLIEGDSAHFECKLVPINDPNLRVEWYHNGKPLISGHRFKTTHDFGFVALDILYVYPEDSGEYVARAVNQVGEDVTTAVLKCKARQKIIYHTQLPKEMETGVQKIAEMESSWQRTDASEDLPQERMVPMFVMKPEPQSILEGEWAKFGCRVIGYPRPKVIWVLNGNTIVNGSRYKLSYDGIYHLDIPKSRQYDAGKVEVYARNLLGQAYCCTTLDVKPRNADYRAVLKNSPRPWYDQQVKKYQKDRKNTELDKVFEEKLTPGGTEVEVWRTQAAPEGERVKIREHVKDDTVSKPDAKRYSTETTFLDTKSGKPKQDNQSQVSWMAKSYQTKLKEKEPYPTTSPESSIYGKEIQTKVQRQEQIEEKDNVKIKRTIKTTETFQQEHKDSTKERKVIGPPSDSKPPTFSKKLQPVRAFEGEKAIFECYFQGTPTPNITWFRENFEIQSSKDFEIITTEDKSTLAIKEVYLEDSGMFSVKAENRVGSAKSSANLIVEERRDQTKGAVPPSFSKTIDDTRAKAGELVRLDARVIGSKPRDVYWLKNGAKMTPGVTHKMIDDDDQNTLLILEPVPEDSGIYECVAINQVGEARCQARVIIEGPPSASVSRHVTPKGQEKPPKSIVPLKDSTVQEGQAALFKCQISGVTASQVAWYKGDSLIKQSRYFRMGNDRDVFTLRISEAFPEDEGVYKCVASNSAGTLSTTARLYVTASGSESVPPRLAPLHDIIVPEGSSARFVTSLVGLPVPSISWFREGRLIKPSKDFQISQDHSSCSLMIRQTYPEDEGMYTCQATNDIGQCETSARLIVESKLKQK